LIFTRSKVSEEGQLQPFEHKYFLILPPVLLHRQGIV